MPLKSGKSKKTISENISELIGSGRDPKQAWNKGLQTEKVLNKMEKFKQNLPINCKKHGDHTSWRLHTGNNVQCKICSTENAKKNRKKDPIKRVLRDLKSRKYEININESYLINLLNKQNNCCALTGIQFNNEIDNLKLSLDRIDSKKGYVKNNVQFVLFMVNRMKSDFELTDFLEMCKNISIYNKEISNAS